MTPPTQETVWPGCVLASIAHAISNARFPSMSYEQSWDGSNYNIQDSAGSRATIAFDAMRFVGIAFYRNSTRNPWLSNNVTDVDYLLQGMPSDMTYLARVEALQYLLQEYDGKAIPMATAAFWGDGMEPHVRAAEPWDSAVAHGLCLLRRQLLSMEEGLREWSTENDFSDAESSLLRNLYARKLRAGRQEVYLTMSESELVQTIATDEEGLEECRKSLAEIGIHLV